MPRRDGIPANAPNEHIDWLRSMPYSEYRISRWWRRRRQSYIDSVIRRQGRKYCELCLIVGEQGYPIRFNVHHTTYEHLGDERDEDLKLLCAACHNLVHFPDSHAAVHWANLRPHLNLGERARSLHPEREIA
jgi:5-methylcytosine-specific restriction endonuclease McrA